MIAQIFTPISLLKKVFRLGERSLARQEVSHRLQNICSGETEEIIEAALSCQKSPFREGNSKAIIEFHQETQGLSSHAFRVLNEWGIPVTEEQLLRKLRGLNLVSWGFPFERLGLQTDHRFLQLSDNRWLLKDWELVNDEVYNYLVQHETTELLLMDIPFLIQMKLGLTKKKYLFLPEYDERFQQDETRLYILSSHAQLEAEDLQKTKAENTSFMEVAAAMSQEILVDKSKTTVVDEVIHDLLGSLIKLEKRSTEMKDEVVGHFSSNNLEAIRDLMTEKEKNEKVLLKLKEIVDELT